MSLAPLIQAILGLLLLVVGGDLLIRGSTRLAAALGIPPLVIGLTVVGFGTSAPELAVSVQASLSGNPGVALGNVLGSNIFNILFILGVSALLAPLTIQRQLIRLDVPVMVLASGLAYVFLADGVVGRVEAGSLLLLGVGYISYLSWIGLRRGPQDAPPSASVGIPLGPRHRLVDVALIVLGLGILVYGADQLVEGSVILARGLGASELVIGLTLVAAGTSLPEVATSILASIRGERDLAVGNVVGSNIFNLLFVLGGAGLASSGGLLAPPGALTFDVPVMVGAALACYPIFLTGRAISRWEGGIFLLYYGLYLALLFLDASSHDSRDLLLRAILQFVLPLTLVTALLGWLWRIRSDAGAALRAGKGSGRETDGARR
jgi:cation:H+ antiporter